MVAKNEEYRYGFFVKGSFPGWLFVGLEHVRSDSGAEAAVARSIDRFFHDEIGESCKVATFLELQA